MIIYNQTSTSKKYTSGILMGFFIVPAILLFMQGFVLYGIVLIFIYLAIETSRTGVDFNFDEAKFSGFREVLFFIKIQQGKSNHLNAFSHYRVTQAHTQTTVFANWVQHSTISQEQCELALFDKHKGEFLPIVQSDFSQIQPLLVILEAQQIISEN